MSSPNWAVHASAAAASHPARAPPSRRPRPQAISRVSVPATAEGTRAAASEAPSAWKAAVCAHQASGGFSRKGWPLRRGTTWSPLSHMALPIAASRGSSGVHRAWEPMPANDTAAASAAAPIAAMPADPRGHTVLPLRRGAAGVSTRGLYLKGAGPGDRTLPER